MSERRKLTGPKRWAGALGSVVVVMALSGCGDIDAGDGAAASFRTWMAGTPGVAETTVNGANLLPWAAEVTATLTLEDSLGDSQVVAVADRALAYDSGRHSLHVTLTQVVAGARTSITLPSRPVSIAAVVAYRDRVAPAIAGGEVRLDVQDREGTSAAPSELNLHVETVVGAPKAVLPTFDALRAVPPGPEQPGVVLGTLRVHDTDSTMYVKSHDPGRDQLTRRVYDMVSAQYPVRSARIEDTSLSMTVDAANRENAQLLGTRIGIGVVVTVLGTPVVPEVPHVTPA